MQLMFVIVLAAQAASTNAVSLASTMTTHRSSSSSSSSSASFASLMLRGQQAAARSPATNSALSVSIPSEGYVSFGDTACPCIGFDNIDGKTTVEMEDGQKVVYPADLGARCEKWDDNVHPLCKAGQEPGPGNGWCGQAWCFVDSCHCSLPVLPTQSMYVPDARYRGRPLFYSFATCGGEDMWLKEKPKVGLPGCRCVAFSNVPGTTEVTVRRPGAANAEVVEYPAEMGGTCKAWDDSMHPECKGPNQPEWCQQRWCYVDPCACNIEAPPKVTMYLPMATFTGKSLYYSYETCGSTDTFTESRNLEACVNQENEVKCLSLKVRGGVQKCAWTGSRCLGAELVNHPLCEHIAEDIKKEEEAKNGAGSLRLGVPLLAAFATLFASV